MLPLTNYNVLPVNMQRGQLIHPSKRTCCVLDYLTEVYRHSEHESYWLEAPLPRTSAEALTEGKPIANEPGYPVSKALCGALRRRHLSQRLSVGAVLSKPLARSCHTSERYCLPLVPPCLSLLHLAV